MFWPKCWSCFIFVQVTEYESYKHDYEGEYDDDMYMRREYGDGEDGEMSWFNAGATQWWSYT